MKMDTDDSAVEHLELPEISEYDKKQYRAIRLTNEMKVILVHDDKVQENEKHECWPACALNITVGSLSDPSGLEGLATFLGKYMIFVDCLAVHEVRINDQVHCSNSFLFSTQTI